MAEAQEVTREDKLREEYELEDDSFDPEIDAQPDPKAKPAVAPVAAEKPSTSDKPRGPNGKFHPASLVRLAKQLTFSDEDIASCNTEALEQMVTREVAKIREQPQPTLSAGSPPPEPGPAPKAAPKPESKDVQWVTDPNSYDPLIKQLAEEINNLRRELGHRDDRLQNLEQGITGIQAERAYTKVDEGFANLGKQYSGVFGSGAGDSLGATDPAFLRRVDVVEHVRNNPIKGMSIQAQIAKRAKEVYGDLVKGTPVVHEEPAPSTNGHAPVNRIAPFTEQEFEDSQVAPATSRRGAPEPKGKRRAAKAVAEILRNSIQRQGEGTEEDDLPE